MQDRKKKVQQSEKQNKESGSFMQNIMRKLLIYAASLLLVAGVVGTIFYFQNKKMQQEAAQIAAEEEAAKEQAKAAMTEEEIQELFKAHKVDAAAKDDGNSVEDVKNDTESAAQDSSSENTEGSENLEDAEGDLTSQESSMSPVDWEGLWEINPDVYAWITVPGTIIDYPILQHATDNTYYLNYNIDGSYGYPGCIYTENLNSKDFTDNNTVIYGHNMKNGTMFAGLHQFEDKSFFDANQNIYIYTPDEAYTYTIFSSYIYDDRHLLYSFDFANADVYASYLENIQSMRDLNANLRTDVTVTKEDKITTLVTCMANQPDKRLLVQAVLEE